MSEPLTEEVEKAIDNLYRAAGNAVRYRTASDIADGLEPRFVPGFSGSVMDADSALRLAIARLRDEGKPKTCESCEWWHYPQPSHSDGACTLHKIGKVEREDFCSWHQERRGGTP